MLYLENEIINLKDKTIIRGLYTFDPIYLLSPHREILKAPKGDQAELLGKHLMGVEEGIENTLIKTHRKLNKQSTNALSHWLIEILKAPQGLL